MKKTKEGTNVQINRTQGRLNHSSICSGTGLLRGEQDGSWCQHEFASLVCLRGELEKTAQSHWVGAPRPRPSYERLTSVIRRCGWLTQLSVVSTETLFFPFPCFPTSRLLRVFLNRKWDMSDEKLTKIWPTPMENSGFCDRICRISLLLHRNCICKSRFPVYHFICVLFCLWNLNICLYYFM